MADRTHIEWTDATWNIVTGCTRVSDGCDHCYIERTPPFRVERRTFTKSGVGGTAGVRLHPERLVWPLRWRRPRRIFVCSLADLFHDDVPDDHIARAFAAMALTARHTFQVLTKRPSRMRSLLTDADFIKTVADWATELIGSRAWQRWQLDLGGQRLAGDSGLGGVWTTTPTAAGTVWSPPWPLPNVWLGVSVESQRWADIRIPHLLQTPAALHWVSAEPLLGQLQLYPEWLAPASRFCGPPGYEWTPADMAAMADLSRAVARHAGNGAAYIGWVVTGGESGPGARPMHPDWARSLRDECRRYGVAYLHKQWGEWTPIGPLYSEDPSGDDQAAEDARIEAVALEVVEGREVVQLESSGMVAANYQPGDPRTWLMARLGKRAAGRHLDGRLHDEYPGDQWPAAAEAVTADA